MLDISFALLRDQARPRGTARQRRVTWQQRRQRLQRAWKAVTRRVTTLSPVAEVHDSLTLLLQGSPMTPQQFLRCREFRRSLREWKTYLTSWTTAIAESAPVALDLVALPPITERWMDRVVRVTSDPVPAAALVDDLLLVEAPSLKNLDTLLKARTREPEVIVNLHWMDV